LQILSERGVIKSMIASDCDLACGDWLIFVCGVIHSNL
jgi:hypothetical protein